MDDIDCKKVREIHENPLHALRTAYLKDFPPSWISHNALQQRIKRSSLVTLFSQINFTQADEIK